MAKKLVVSKNARNDITGIMKNVVDYTSHTTSGIKIYNEIREKFDLITMLPKCGKQKDDGTREIFARSYRIVYEEMEDSVVILTVIHARKLYPPQG